MSVLDGLSDLENTLHHLNSLPDGLFVSPPAFAPRQHHDYFICLISKRISTFLVELHESETIIGRNLVLYDQI
jgi:hypothetical protein